MPIAERRALVRGRALDQSVRGVDGSDPQQALQSNEVAADRRLEEVPAQMRETPDETHAVVAVLGRPVLEHVVHVARVRLQVAIGTMQRLLHSGDLRVGAGPAAGRVLVRRRFVARTTADLLARAGSEPTSTQRTPAYTAGIPWCSPARRFRPRAASTPCKEAGTTHSPRNTYRRPGQGRAHRAPRPRDLRIRRGAPAHPVPEGSGATGALAREGQHRHLDRRCDRRSELTLLVEG